MTSHTFHLLQCDSCSSTYPADGPTEKRAQITPLRDEAEAKGWEVQRNRKGGVDRCPLCRIRAIELAADLPGVVEPSR